jgi:transcriptional regulator with XRE-family HTH domain
MGIRTPNRMDQQLGWNIRRIRKTAGLTQASVADAFGVTSQQLNKYEHGMNRIAATRLLVLAGILSCPVMDFYAGIEVSDLPYCEGFVPSL